MGVVGTVVVGVVVVGVWVVLFVVPVPEVLFALFAALNRTNSPIINNSNNTTPAIIATEESPLSVSVLESITVVAIDINIKNKIINSRVVKF